MFRLLLDDAEDPGGGLASLLAGRHRRPEDPALGVIHGDHLAAERNDRHDGLASDARRGGFDLACAMTARGSGRIPGRYQRGQSRKAKVRGQPCSLDLWVHTTRTHVSSTWMSCQFLETSSLWGLRK